MPPKNFSRFEIPIFIMKTFIWSATIFVDSVRTILIPSAPMDENRSFVWSHFPRTKSYISGNSIKTGTNAIALFPFYKKNSRLSYGRVLKNLLLLSVTSRNKYKRTSNTLKKKVRIKQLTCNTSSQFSQNWQHLYFKTR